MKNHIDDIAATLYVLTFGVATMSAAVAFVVAAF